VTEIVGERPAKVMARSSMMASVISTGVMLIYACRFRAAFLAIAIGFAVRSLRTQRAYGMSHRFQKRLVKLARSRRNSSGLLSAES
jgi:hypothetical protein